MAGEIFYWVFNMSVASAVTGAVVMLLRLIRRIPRRVIELLWIIPFLRMVIPVGLDSPYSLMSLLSRFAFKNVTVYALPDIFSVSMSNSLRAADSYFPITYKVNVLCFVFGTAAVVWLTVAAAVLLTLWIIYSATIRELKDAEAADGIYYSDKILSPAVYGIIRPRIILPGTYRTRDNEFVLLHEMMHIRRRDNLKRMIAFTVTAVHWFNPLAWLFLKLYLSDMELACDEGVLSGCGEERKKEYASALVSCRENSRSVFTSAFGGAGIRTRIENILSYKKMTWVSSIGFSILCAAIFFVLLTNGGK